jgi:predicted porin
MTNTFSSIATSSWRLAPGTLTAGALACASLGFGASDAAAQSTVSMYGHVDASVVSSRSGAPGAGTVTSIASGVGSASRWGLRGVEDLGGGMKALFQLELGFDLDTGAFKAFTGDYASATPTAPTGAPATGFNRRSVVGLETEYGTLVIGREYTPLFYTAVATDTILGAQYIGNIQSLTSLLGGPERSARNSNSLAYTSPSMGGFRFRAAYGLGSESAGGVGRPPKNANRFIGVGGEYIGGGLTVSGSLQRVSVPLTAGTPAAFTFNTKRTDMALGTRYVFGNYSVSAGHFRVKGPVDGSDTWLGGSFTFGPNTLYAQMQRIRQDNAAGAERQATILGLTFTHALSKRTTVYTSYGRTSNNATGQFALLANDTVFPAGAPGAKPSAWAIGLRHAF